jgi:hypothetical protein
MNANAIGGGQLAFGAVNPIKLGTLLVSLIKKTRFSSTSCYVSDLDDGQNYTSPGN